MNTRRTLLMALGGALAAPRLVYAQQGKPLKVTFVYFGTRQSALDLGRLAAFTQGLRELGYEAGRNLALEERYADGKAGGLGAIAAEVAGGKPDIIVATGGPLYRVLRQATSTIPVIVTVVADPIIDGYAKSLSQPGGNFTGFTIFAEDLGPKLLELMKESLPKLTQVGVLLNPATSSHPPQVVRIMQGAQRIGVRVWVEEAAAAPDFAARFAHMAQKGVNAVIVLNDTFYVDQLREIAAQALKHRLPSIMAVREYAAAGGLMSYGANLTDNFRRAATYVDKIAKGAKAGTLPFEAPMRYYLTINGKTAKALNVKPPNSVLVRVEKVLE